MSTDQEKRINSALDSDHHSRSAYTGRIQQTETVILHDENGVPIQKDISFFISWDSIAKLLAIIKERAGL